MKTKNELEIGLKCVEKSISENKEEYYQLQREKDSILSQLDNLKHTPRIGDVIMWLGDGPYLVRREVDSFGKPTDNLWRVMINTGYQVGYSEESMIEYYRNGTIKVLYNIFDKKGV